MTEGPKVSIIIPSYNHSAYIGLLIESVYSQTYKNFELIVLDDGSKDNSPALLTELAAKFGFKLILKENEGLCATLNKGIVLASGKYIVNIGSDDIMPPERLSEQVYYLEVHSDVDVIGGCMKLIDENNNFCGVRIPAKMGNITFADMTIINRLQAPSVMIRSSVFERFGTYPTNYLLEDYYLWLKVLSGGGKIHNVDKFWVFYRISNENLEKKFTWYYKGASQALEPYAKEKGVAMQLHKNHLFYCIKLCLLLGTFFKLKYRENYLELSWPEKFLLSCISILPSKFRNQILIGLKLKV